MINLKRYSTQLIITLVAMIGIMTFASRSGTTDVNDRVLCHAMGIDFEDNKYKVTMQLFKASSAGSDTPIDTTQSNVRIIETEGNSVSEALETCENSLGKEVFLGHLQIIALGRSVNLSNPLDLFDFCLKEKNEYLGLKICLSGTTAEELMKTEITSGAMSSENYINLINTNVQNGQTVDCEIVDFISCIKSRQNIAVPIILAESKTAHAVKGTSDQPSDPVLELQGTALIKDGRVLEEYLTTEEVKGIALLDDETEEVNLSVRHQGGMMNVRVTRNIKDVKLLNYGGKLVYTVKLHVVAHSAKDIVGNEESAALSAQVTKLLDDSFNKVYVKTIVENEVDILGVWKLLRHSYPKSYSQYEKNMKPIYDNLEYRYVIDCRVD